MAAMNDKILFVDDEPSVLEGYKRLLGRDVHADTAIGGELGLAAIAETGPYAVVVSDMRMPQMDGAQFLAKVRDLSPTTVRLALTGYVDIDTAMAAVNEGNIFRFLTKPCSRENLVKAIDAALVQYHLLIAEKELLERTLRESVSVLTEVLSFSNPAAFSRAMRLRRFAQHVTGKLKKTSTWQFEIAAMLSQLGCVTLAPELVNAAYSGDQLSAEDQSKFDAHPAFAWEMVSRIPRLEAVAQMIACQNKPQFQVRARSEEEKQEIEFGIQLLQAGVMFEKYLSRGLNPMEAARGVRAALKTCDEAILRCLDDLVPSMPMHARDCAIADLAVGMTLQQDVFNDVGMLVVAKGQELTNQWIERLKGLSRLGVIGRRATVLIPASQSESSIQLDRCTAAVAVLAANR
jgi:response regulator RpfG family c-di-GMP phosphodiesterase